jgi:hypothetical protein
MFAMVLRRLLEPCSSEEFRSDREGFELAPHFEYVHKAERRPRNDSGAIDVGAYEYQDGP